MTDASTTSLWPVTMATAPYKQRGIMWDVIKKPTFKTVRQMAVTGREARTAAFSRAIYDFLLKWDILEDDGSKDSNATAAFPQNELKAVVGFFLARKGGFDPFFFQDPWDKHTTAEVISANVPATNIDPTNPSSRNFQLVRTYGGTTEPVGGMNTGAMGEPVPVIRYNGTPTTAYTANAVFDGVNVVPRDGWICMDAAPTPSGKVLDGDYSFYFRQTFKDDATEFHTFLHNFWEIRQITLTGAWY